uniref:Uncharacterized protein n=1 Tax=viral metagenome TaxID=1070528 RepID=A0A6C0AYC0_9ZZZZ|tara:strand:- start:3913 stop:4272 length:360 start_codon:yes stop_codon:yes gene_type:complete
MLNALEKIDTCASLNDLIQLKFNVEHEYSTLYNTFDQVKKMKLLSINKDVELYTILRVYSQNIEHMGNEFLEKQKNLLEQINEILMKKCNHNWIEDTIDEPFRSRDICYCSNCYIYKKK